MTNPPPETPDQQIRRLLAPYLEGDYVTADVAADFVDQLHRENPVLLATWFDQQAVEIVRVYIGAGRRANRKKTRIASIFDSTEIIEEDDEEEVSLKMAQRTDELSVFVGETYQINDKKVFRHLGDMTKADCQYVADGYADRERNNSMLKMFWQVVVNRVRTDDTVKDHFTEEEFLTIRNSFRS